MQEYRGITDREVYPALWITMAACLIGYGLWRFALGQPTIRACWFYAHYHIYCPACGGTRALIAFSHGAFGRALYYNPAVPITFFSVGGYLVSQTIWRLRGRKGMTLHYSNRWLWVMLVVLLGNCLIRNVLWLGFHIPIS
jgi:hypothetical protein